VLLYDEADRTLSLYLSPYKHQLEYIERGKLI